VTTSHTRNGLKKSRTIHHAILLRLHCNASHTASHNALSAAMRDVVSTHIVEIAIIMSKTLSHIIVMLIKNPRNH